MASLGIPVCHRCVTVRTVASGVRNTPRAISPRTDRNSWVRSNFGPSSGFTPVHEPSSEQGKRKAGSGGFTPLRAASVSDSCLYHRCLPKQHDCWNEEGAAGQARSSVLYRASLTFVSTPNQYRH
jgi:hypothetical protein